MSNYKRIVSIILSVALLLSFAACGASKPSEEAVSTDYNELSNDIFNDNLGEFRAAYEKALLCSNNSERYALMAIAEAKFLESAVFLPLYAIGGTYSISNVAAYSIPNVLWGLDRYRYKNAIVVKGDPISLSDRSELLEKYSELRGSGNYLEYAKTYLVDNGYSLSDYYGLDYSENPTSWDIMNTYLTGDWEAIVNTLDLLMEYDCEGELKPALAESYTVSDDGLVYTFTLRQGVKWVDNQGREMAELTADDFVCGMQHLLDCHAGIEYLAGSAGANIKNADNYLGGIVTDFAEVGIKAIDEYTVEYTLEEPTSYFMTFTTMGLMAPINRAYYESQGGKYASEFDASASDYLYGKDYQHILSCGAYIVSSYAENNSIVFEQNPLYYDKDNMTVKKIKWLFNDGTDPLMSYNWRKSGEMSFVNLNASAIEKAKEDEMFDKYAFVRDNDSTCYGMFTNINRQSYANTNDSTKAVSSKTEEQKSVTSKLMANVHFRRALFMSIDRGTYNAQSAGENLKFAALVNSYTPGTFVSTTEDISIDINGSMTEFKAGTYYGEILQTQIDADGFGVKVWDPDANEGIGSSFGYDGWYNPENARAELDLALSETGIELSTDNPVYIDLPVNTASTKYINRENVLKQSIENAFEGKIIVNLVECANTEEWFYAGYYGVSGKDCNYDIYDVSGWGADYGDPKTYLSAFYGPNGDLTTHIGIY